MKILIIYASFHRKNTEKIAKVMADEIGADLVKPHEITQEDLGNYD